jgi:cholesterol transport system auxiliary component
VTALRRHYAAMAAAAALMMSCALPGQEREMTTWLLEWNGSLAAARPSFEPCVAVLITTPVSAPGYATARMAYTQQDHRVDYFATHRWADTPARMLSPLLARALQTSGLFKAAVESPAPINAQLRLESEVLELRQVFSPGDSKMQLKLKVHLFDLANNRLLASRVFSVTEPTETRDPYGGVVAANRAVARMFEQLVEFLGDELRDASLGCREAANALSMDIIAVFSTSLTTLDRVNHVTAGLSAGGFGHQFQTIGDRVFQPHGRNRFQEPDAVADVEPRR